MVLKIGRSYYEADPETSDRETVLQGSAWRVHEPDQVLEIDKAAGTCRDETREFMAEVEERAAA